MGAWAHVRAEVCKPVHVSMLACAGVCVCECRRACMHTCVRASVHGVFVCLCVGVSVSVCLCVCVCVWWVFGCFGCLLACLLAGLIACFGLFCFACLLVSVFVNALLKAWFTGNPTGQPQLFASPHLPMRYCQGRSFLFACSLAREGDAGGRGAFSRTRIWQDPENVCSPR